MRSAESERSCSKNHHLSTIAVYLVNDWPVHRRLAPSVRQIGTVEAPASAGRNLRRPRAFRNTFGAETSRHGISVLEASSALVGA
jgi:hypothetical protein